MVLDAGVWDDEHAAWAPNLDLTTSSYHQLVGRVPRVDDDGRPVRARIQPVTRSGKTNLRKGQQILDYSDRPVPDLNRQWDTLIADEAHHLCGHDNHWTKAFAALAKRADRVILATGSPIPNWAWQMFPLLQILHPDQTKPGGEYGARWRWIQHWFPVGNKYARSGKLLTRWGIEPRMRACPEDCPGLDDGSCEHWAAFRAENLDGLILARSWDDLGFSLPPLTGWTDELGRPKLFKVKMTKEQRKVYDQLKKEFVAWADSGVQIEAWSQAGLQTKLRQVATGLEVADPALRGSGKLDALQTLMDARRRPTVVIGWHHNTLDAIAIRMAELGLSCYEVSGRTPSRNYRRQTIQEFKRGGIDVLAGQIDTVAEGLTLTRADNLIMVESSYRPDRNEQVMRKLWRLGQERPVHVDRMATTNSLDINVMRIIHTKRAHQLATLPPGQYAKML